MSYTNRPCSSSAIDAGNGKRGRGEKHRGIPKSCRCGEDVVIKTSGTAKNPGRLFYCCPNGSEGDKTHLFALTDERVVEEVEDMKVTLSDIKADLSDMRTNILGLQRECELNKPYFPPTQAPNCCCNIL